MLLHLVRAVRLVACCDPVRDRAEALARRHRVPAAYGDYGEMLGREALDAVYLAVPHDLHLAMARAAVARGVHVLVEKPLAGTLEEGRALVALAREADVCVGVNYQYRYDAGCYALAQAARSGALGRLYYGRCNVPWHRDAVYFEEGAWRGQRARAGGGTLLTQGSHALDVLLWALGGRPVVATGQTARLKFEGIDVEDVAQGTVVLDRGTLVQLSSAMVARPEQAVTLELYGERGTAIYRDRPWPHVRFRGVRVGRARPPAWGVHALQRSLAAFGAWVLHGRPYLTPAAEALPVLAAVDAVYRAAASGRRQAIELWPTVEDGRQAAAGSEDASRAGGRR
jgi:predicted dehydrogenase